MFVEEILGSSEPPLEIGISIKKRNNEVHEG